MLKTIKFCTCLFVLLFTSCQDSLEYELEFSGSKLVINGLLRANQVPEVFVGRTWPATGAIPRKPFVDNAVVSIYANNKLVGTMTYTTNGYYKLPGHTLLVGTQYVIRVEAAGFEGAESRPVTIPKPFPLRSLQYDPRAKVPSPNLGREPRLVRIILADYPEAGNFYAVSIEPYKKGQLQGVYVLPIEKAGLASQSRDDECVKDISLQSLLSRGESFSSNTGVSIASVSALIYSDACFAEPEKELGVVVETLIQEGVLANGTAIREVVDELSVRLFSVSPEYDEYAKTYQIVEGLSNAFVEPQRTYTNVVGGFGIVAALNEYKQTIRIN